MFKSCDRCGRLTTLAINSNNGTFCSMCLLELLDLETKFLSLRKFTERWCEPNKEQADDRLKRS